MNSKQKIVVIVTIVLIATAMLFPPFYHTFGDGRNVVGLGHAFILTPPPLNAGATRFGVIDVPALAAEFVAILLMAGGAWLLAANGNAK